MGYAVKPLESFSPYPHKRINNRGQSYTYEEYGEFYLSVNVSDLHRIHPREKQRNCEECENAFNSSSNLKQKERTYTEQQSYRCEEYWEGLIDHSFLTAHQGNHRWASANGWSVVSCLDVLHACTHIIVFMLVKCTINAKIVARSSPGYHIRSVLQIVWNLISPNNSE